MDWKYLNTEPFYARYVLAAHYMTGCKNVLEVGGAQIYHFLRGPHEHVKCVDPLAVPQFGRLSKFGRLIGRTVEVQDCKISEADCTFYAGAPYGLVSLGYELAPEYLELFSSLVAKSTVAVVESWETWPRFVQMVRYVLDHTKKEINVRMSLDLSGNDFGDLTGSWPARTNRRLYVLR